MLKAGIASLAVHTTCKKLSPPEVRSAMQAPRETLSTEFTFRNATLRDLDALYALDCICFDEAFRFSRTQMQRYLQRKGAIVPLAEVRDGIAGFAIAHVNQRAAYLMTLDVAPPHRGQGLGQKLLERTERACADAGATVLWLHVWERNDPAIKLYMRCGFVKQGVEKNFYPGRNHAVVFAKTIGPDLVISAKSVKPLRPLRSA